MDARINEAWLKQPTRYLSHTLEESAEGMTLAVTLTLGPLTIIDGFYLIGPLVERTIRISMPKETADKIQLNGVRFIIPHAAVGDPAGCYFEAPASAVRPRLPLSLAARQTLEALVEKSYSTFKHPQVTPVTPRGDVYILELFHGPTLAFKDVALQFLGNLFEEELQKRGSSMNILGATSGDTGSAAIHGVRGKDRINIFILHPDGRVSPIQKLNLTVRLTPRILPVLTRPPLLLPRAV